MAKSDIETGGVTGGNNELYPGMKESSELRWAFIRKVYVILSLQMILTVGVSAVVFFVRPIPDFIKNTNYGLVVFFVSLLLPFLSFVSVFSRLVPPNFLLFLGFDWWVSMIFIDGFCFHVFVVLWPLFVYEKKHPTNLILLSLFTLSISFAVGFCCAFSKGIT